MKKLNVVVWGEFVHEKKNATVAKIYPDGMHEVIAAGLRELDTEGKLNVSTATLQEPEHGLPQERVQEIDVLLWWGHCAHGEVEDRVVDRLQERVLAGMGLVVLHSGHFSKIFKRLMGTSCALKWREAGEREHLWVTNPGHPIAQGVGEVITLENTEMYGEPFGIPEPEEQVFLSWFQGGEVFRSGCCWHRGNGRIFYFRPGHETYPIYYDKMVRRVIYNGVLWAQPQGVWSEPLKAPNVPVEKALEKIEARGGSLHEPGQQGLR